MLDLINNCDLCVLPPRVLVVENDALHRDIIATFLPAPSYFVDFATNGAEGLEMALTRSYDVILTDLRMPKMTGDKMVEKLRRHQHLLGHCQIAVMSSMPYDVIGVSAYLRKPFKQAELKHLVDKQASITHENRRREGTAAMHSSKLRLGYDAGGMPRLVWGETEERFKLDPRLLPLSATQREQKGWRVLLCLEDQTETNTLTTFLRAHGFQVQTATSDAEFSSRANKGFDLIVVDHSISKAAIQLACTKFSAKTQATIAMLAQHPLQADHVDLLIEKPIESGELIGILSTLSEMRAEQRNKSQSIYSRLARSMKQLRTLFGMHSFSPC